MSRTTRALSGGTFLLVQMALRIGLPFVISPLLLKLTDAQILGAYAITLEITGYLLLLDLGMSQSIMREIALRGRSSGRTDGTAAIATTGVLFLAGVGVVVGILTYGLAATVGLWLKADEPTIISAAMALAMLALWMPIRFPLSFFQLALFARQDITLYATADIAGDLLKAALSIVLVLMGYGLPGLVAATIVAQACTYALCLFWARDQVSVMPWRSMPDPMLLRRLLTVGLPISVMSLADRITFYSQTIIVGTMFDARIAAAYYATRTPGFFASSVIWRMLDSVVPGLSELYGRGLRTALASAYVRLSGYAVGLGLWVGAGIWAFNQPLIGSWLGQDLYLGKTLTIAVAVMAPVSAFKNISAKLVVIEGRPRSYMWVVMAEAVLATVLSVLLGKVAGAAAILWGTVLAHLLTTTYLLVKTASILDAAWKGFLTIVARRSIEGGIIGILACVTYLVSQVLGIHVPWILALVMVVLVGTAGFTAFGLTDQDRASLGLTIRTAIPYFANRK